MKLSTAVRDALRGSRKTKEAIADQIAGEVLEDVCVVLLYRIRESGKTGRAAAMEVFDLKLAEIAGKRRIGELKDALVSANFFVSAYEMPEARIMAEKISEKLSELKSRRHKISISMKMTKSSDG